MPTRTARLIRQKRAELIAENPICSRCGIEPSNYSDLQYHHNVPQHTGYTDHLDGILLCQQCHSAIHTVDRNRHKQINPETGYPYTDKNPYYFKKNILERKRQDAQRMVNAWV